MGADVRGRTVVFSNAEFALQYRSCACTSRCRLLYPKDRIVFRRLTANSAVIARLSIECKYVNNTLENRLYANALYLKIMPVLRSVVKFVCAV